MNYKYAVGQTVNYHTTETKWKKCGECGSETPKTIYKKNRGKIEKIGRQTGWALSNGFGPTDFPQLPPQFVTNPMLLKEYACYLIDGIWYEETNLTLARGRK